jgi:release factor glutamine methyltransferase
LYSPIRSKPAGIGSILAPTKDGAVAAGAQQHRWQPDRTATVARLRAAGCVFAEDEADLLISATHSAAELAGLIERRAAGQPIEHLLGWAQFCGLRVAVQPGVFVPRRRTELLVRLAAGLLRPGAVVLDLCCGCGAVAAALADRSPAAAFEGQAAEGPAVEVHAVDLTPAAVDCARRNLAAGTVYLGDLFDPLPATLRGRVDVLVANAPYVPSEAIRLMPPEARDHEPRSALDGGADGLDIQRRIIAGAPSWLADGGHLLIETSRDQAPMTAAAMTDSGLSARVVTAAELDATVVVGAWRAVVDPVIGAALG